MSQGRLKNTGSKKKGHDMKMLQRWLEEEYPKDDIMLGARKRKRDAAPAWREGDRRVPTPLLRIGSRCFVDSKTSRHDKPCTAKAEHPHTYTNGLPLRRRRPCPPTSSLPIPPPLPACVHKYLPLRYLPTNDSLVATPAGTSVRGGSPSFVPGL